MAGVRDDRMQRLVTKLREDPGLVAGLPREEGEIVQAALDGQSVYEIAGTHGMSEGAIWDLLTRAARAAAGPPVVPQPETGGMGSDTDPGVTGGYGETGFGSLGNEGPVPIPEEPPQQG